jgi:hypothetical protein
LTLCHREVPGPERPLANPERRERQLFRFVQPPLAVTKEPKIGACLGYIQMFRAQDSRSD